MWSFQNAPDLQNGHKEHWNKFTVMGKPLGIPGLDVRSKKRHQASRVESHCLHDEEKSYP